MYFPEDCETAHFVGAAGWQAQGGAPDPVRISSPSGFQGAPLGACDSGRSAAWR